VHDERAVGRGQAVQRGLDIVERRERIQPPAPRLELTRCLRPAEQEQGDDREVGPIQPERLVEHVPVLHHALARRLDPARQLLLAQPLQRGLDGRLAVGDHRLAIGRLVAGGDEPVQREWIALGCRERLLRERADDARFLVAEHDADAFGFADLFLIVAHAGSDLRSRESAREASGAASIGV